MSENVSFYPCVSHNMAGQKVIRWKSFSSHIVKHHYYFLASSTVAFSESNAILVPHPLYVPFYPFGSFQDFLFISRC